VCCDPERLRRQQRQPAAVRHHHTGLTKTGLVLINKSNGEKLPIDTGASTFVHPLLANDEAFDVEIETQPTGASARAANTGSANVYNVYRRVTCASNPTRWAAPSRPERHRPGVGQRQ
jgi:hypothetical protein